MARQRKTSDNDYTKMVSIVFHNRNSGSGGNEEIKEFDRCLDLFQDEMGFPASRTQFVMYLLKHYKVTKGIDQSPYEGIE